MTFTVWDYFIPSLGMLFVFIIVMLAIFLYIFKLRPNKSGKKPPAINATHFCLMLCSFALVALYSIPSVRYWADLFDSSSRSTIIGEVEDICSAGITPVYYDTKHTKFCTSSFITISGVDYYTLTAEGVKIGDHLAITYCNDGRAVSAWRRVLDGTNNPIPSDTALHMPAETTQANQTAFALSPIHAIALTLILLFAISVCTQNQCLAYFDSNDCSAPGVVIARKINFYSCRIELASIFFCVLSLLTGVISLIIVAVLVSVCLWSIQWSIQKSIVLYEGNQLLFRSFFRRSTYSISDISNFEFVRSKQGFKQLRIQFIGTTRLSLGQDHYCGLNGLYTWLEDRTEIKP